MTDKKKIEILTAACEVGHRAIVDLAYLASDLSEVDAEQTVNQPFNEEGYAYLANRQIEKALKITKGKE